MGDVCLLAIVRSFLFHCCGQWLGMPNIFSSLPLSLSVSLTFSFDGFVIVKCMQFFSLTLKRNFPSTGCTIFTLKHDSSANIPMIQMQRNDFLVQMCYGLLNWCKALNYLEPLHLHRPHTKILGKHDRLQSTIYPLHHFTADRSSSINQCSVEFLWLNYIISQEMPIKIRQFWKDINASSFAFRITCDHLSNIDLDFIALAFFLWRNDSLNTC